MYKVYKKGKGLKFIFSAELANVDALCEEVRRTIPFDRQEGPVFVTQLLLREALNNAVIHGCNSDRKRIVECTIKQSKTGLIIDVKDEGEGFCVQEIFDAGSDSGKDSGRGLAIMKAYAEEVSFNKKGNRLTIKISNMPR